MRGITRLVSPEQIRLLADGRRLAILRRLLAEPATLSQLGKAFGKHPAWIRHHVKVLESAGLVALARTQVVGGFVEKYYEATGQGFAITGLVLPEWPDGRSLVLTGSHDLALERLGARLAHRRHGSRLYPWVLGSLDGLIALRQGAGHLAGCHLLDVEAEEYNAPYVARLFPGQEMVLVTLAHREQGLVTRRGNPLAIHGLEDLARPDVRLANRIRGSGTRIWLDRRMRELGLTGSRVRGYERELATHTDVASAVAEGSADLGLAIRAAGTVPELDFIPLFKERYDLVMPLDLYQSHQAMPLLDELHQGAFWREVEALGGYDTAHSGESRQLTG